jgi:hypothetical protein
MKQNVVGDAEAGAADGLTEEPEAEDGAEDEAEDGADDGADGADDKNIYESEQVVCRRH